jgi:hypothetical protein
MPKNQLFKCYPMCPQCGKVFKRHRLSSLIPNHNNENSDGLCKGSRQVPRNSLTDTRPLWSGMPNVHSR